MTKNVPTSALSPCCNARIVDALSLRNIEDKTGQTNWFLCENCHKPCDPPSADQKCCNCDDGVKIVLSGRLRKHIPCFCKCHKASPSVEEVEKFIESVKHDLDLSGEEETTEDFLELCVFLRSLQARNKELEAKLKEVESTLVWALRNSPNSKQRLWFESTLKSLRALQYQHPLSQNA